MTEDTKEPPTSVASEAHRRWRTLRRDPARIGDLFLVFAFGAVLVSPWHSVPRLCSYALALTTLCRPAVWRRLRGAPLAWLAMALLGYLLLTVGWSPAVEPALATRFAIRALVLACFLAAFADCVRRNAAQGIGCWFALVGGVAAVYALADFHLFPPETGRLVGPGQVQNELIAAQAFTVCALFAADAARARAGQWMWTLPLAASAAAASAAVAFAGARAGWLALAVGLGVLFLARGPPARFWRRAALWVFLLTAVAAALAWHEDTRAWLLPRGASFRPLIWELALSRALETAPWLGNGLAANEHLITGERAFLHAHSVYLAVFHQGGAVGLALFTALVCAAAVALSRRLRNPNAPLALALLVAGAVVALFDGHQLIHKVGVVWWLFWLPVAIAVGLTRPETGNATWRRGSTTGRRPPSK